MNNPFKPDIDHRRIFGLDILRTIAILFVLIQHGNYLLPQQFQRAGYALAFDGVTVFFVLSGFLIGGMLIRLVEDDDINARSITRFWSRRLWRTLPAYFLVLIILCACNYFFAPALIPSNQYAYFLFTQNVDSPHPDFFPEAWSISIEECFYVILIIASAAGWLIFKNYRIQVLLWTAIGVIVAVTAIRYYRFVTVPIHSRHLWDEIFRKQVLTRLDSPMFGVIGAWLHNYRHEIWAKHKKLLLISGITLFLLVKLQNSPSVPYDGLYKIVFSLSLLPLSVLLTIPFFSAINAGSGLFSRAVTWISVTSYSIYLLHLSLIQFWIIDRIPWDTLIPSGTLIQFFIKYFLWWILVVTLSGLMYKYFERPMTRLRAEMPPAPKKHLPTLRQPNRMSTK